MPIALTPRVFDTLLHLLARGGELVDKVRWRGRQCCTRRAQRANELIGDDAAA